MTVMGWRLISQLAKSLKRLPALARANNAQAIQDDPNLRASLDQILVGKPLPMATELRAVWDAMRPLFGKVLSGQMGADEAVRRLQADAETKVREMNE